MSVEQHGPDWGPIGAALATIVTAAGGAFAAWNTWGKEKSTAKRDAAGLTLDGVFRLVNELQDEVVRKAAELVEARRLCDEHTARLEARIVALEEALAAQIKANQELRAEIWELKQARGAD